MTFHSGSNTAIQCQNLNECYLGRWNTFSTNFSWNVLLQENKLKKNKIHLNLRNLQETQNGFERKPFTHSV